MGFTQKLVQRQSQSLVMTPQLSQSIKLLAMSNVELSAFVDNELERNPFLDKDEQNGVERGDGPTAEAEERVSTTEKRDALTGSDDMTASAAELENSLGTRLDNVFPDEQDYARADSLRTRREQLVSHERLTGGGADSHDWTIADMAAGTVSLRDHLLEQAARVPCDARERFLLRELIENVDEAGYLDVDEAALAIRFGCDRAEIDRAIAVLQTFEPTGVGATNLAQCLALQLRDKNRLDPAMEKLLERLDLVAARDFEALRKVTGLELADLNDCLAELRALDPKPGTAFASDGADYIEPDILIRAASDGSWIIELNNDTLPRVLVNEGYIAQVSRSLNGAKDKTFVSECLQSASWLTRSLDQRARTILKVTGEVIRRQDAFLMHGLAHLKPLTLREVAEAIDMHESTISRVTTNKYVLTPRGMFELKFFFTSAIKAAEGEESHSSAAVRERIRRLIDAETAETVMSDDAIVDALKASGIDIARRTIAKYRDAMKIPSSVQRRREKRAAAAV